MPGQGSNGILSGLIEALLTNVQQNTQLLTVQQFICEKLDFLLDKVEAGNESVVRTTQQDDKRLDYLVKDAELNRERITLKQIRQVITEVLIVDKIDRQELKKEIALLRYGAYSTLATLVGLIITLLKVFHVF